jgi:hypothetical protein
MDKVAVVGLTHQSNILLLSSILFLTLAGRVLALGLWKFVFSVSVPEKFLL